MAAVTHFGNPLERSTITSTGDASRGLSLRRRYSTLDGPRRSLHKLLPQYLHWSRAVGGRRIGCFSTIWRLTRFAAHAGLRQAHFCTDVVYAPPARNGEKRSVQSGSGSWRLRTNPIRYCAKVFHGGLRVHHRFPRQSIGWAQCQRMGRLRADTPTPMAPCAAYTPAQSAQDGHLLFRSMAYHAGANMAG